MHFQRPKGLVQVVASLFTLVVVSQFYFSGVFIATELIPGTFVPHHLFYIFFNSNPHNSLSSMLTAWIRWAQYLCSLFYGSRLAYIYEFENCDPGEAQENCDKVLRQNGVSVDEAWWYHWLCLAGLFVLFRGMAIITLQQKGISFS